MTYKEVGAAHWENSEDSRFLIKAAFLSKEDLPLQPGRCESSASLPVLLRPHPSGLRQSVFVFIWCKIAPNNPRIDRNLGLAMFLPR